MKPRIDARAAFEAELRAVGAERYHDKHPFNVAMHEGTLSRDCVRMWVANRYYYQKSIPVKDAAIVANLPERFMRRAWLSRIVDHDGTHDGEGGIARWLALGKAVGLDEAVLVSEMLVQPGTRFAVDAYVAFARQSFWLYAVASSLSEMFAPDLMTRRVEALLEKYPWIDPAGLQYFRDRVPLAARDASYALAWVLDYADTEERRKGCVDALRFKCEVLWSMLDAVQMACAPRP